MEQLKTNVSLSEALEIAFQYYQSGQLEQAEQIYRQILNQAPQQPDALHFLGIIAYCRKDFDLAFQLISQAIAMHPEQSQFYNKLGLVLNEQAQLQEASNAFQKAL